MRSEKEWGFSLVLLFPILLKSIQWPQPDRSCHHQEGPQFWNFLHLSEGVQYPGVHRGPFPGIGQQSRSHDHKCLMSFDASPATDYCKGFGLGFWWKTSLVRPKPWRRGMADALVQDNLLTEFKSYLFTITKNACWRFCVAGHPTTNEGKGNRLLITLNVAQWVGMSWAQ